MSTHGQAVVLESFSSVPADVELFPWGQIEVTMSLCDLLGHSEGCPIPAVPGVAALGTDITAEMMLNCAVDIRVPLSLKLRGDTIYHACFPALVILSIGFCQSLALDAAFSHQEN